MAKAIGCISGGLDSTLAVRLIQRQGIEVIALHAKHLWCPLPADECRRPWVETSAEVLGVRVVTIDAADADIDMVLHPRHGLGKRMNPCIDCRIWVLQQAKLLMEKEGAAFVFTGEVLGQRPMSQNIQAMKLIERESGLEGLLVRPLCAQALEPTRPEREGILDRAKLMYVTGRSRKIQMALAKELEIGEYPAPAGGCLLTDPAFAFRLRELIKHHTPTARDIELLKIGRHFRLADGSLLVVGRHEEDNERLEPFFQPGDVRLEAVDVPGPTGLLRGNATPENLSLAASLVLRYIKTRATGAIKVAVTPVGQPGCAVAVPPATEAEAHRWIISPEG